MVLLFCHPHGSMLAASRCACWKTALGVVLPVVQGCKMALCVFHLTQWALCDPVSCRAKTPMSSWAATALQNDFKNKYLVWLSKIQLGQKYEVSMLVDEHFLLFSWGWRKVLSIFARNMLLCSCEGFQHFGHWVLKKSLSAWALQGLLGAASWGFGDEIRMPLPCCLLAAFSQ